MQCVQISLSTAVRTSHWSKSRYWAASGCLRSAAQFSLRASREHFIPRELMNKVLVSFSASECQRVMVLWAVIRGSEVMSTRSKNRGRVLHVFEVGPGNAERQSSSNALVGRDFYSTSRTLIGEAVSESGASRALKTKMQAR